MLGAGPVGRGEELPSQSHDLLFLHSVCSAVSRYLSGSCFPEAAIRLSVVYVVSFFLVGDKVGGAKHLAGLALWG